MTKRSSCASDFRGAKLPQENCKVRRNVAGTYGLISESLASLDAAVLWVNQNAASLIRDGDYDFDGDVDAADYTTWTKQFGSAGPYPIDGDYADGNRDTIVNASDYVIWRKFLGGGSGAFAANPSTSAPEPCSLALVGWAAAAVMLRVRKRE